MNQTDVMDAINKAFANLSDNQMIYDFWLSELYYPDGDFNMDNWNEQTLKLMEQDVMHQVQVNDAYIMENDYNDDI
jgi:hypothetical protein